MRWFAGIHNALTAAFSKFACYGEALDPTLPQPPLQVFRNDENTQFPDWAHRAFTGGSNHISIPDVFGTIVVTFIITVA